MDRRSWSSPLKEQRLGSHINKRDTQDSMRERSVGAPHLGKPLRVRCYWNYGDLRAQEDNFIHWALTFFLAWSSKTQPNHSMIGLSGWWTPDWPTPANFVRLSPKAHCQKSISHYTRDGYCLENTEVIWCLSQPSTRRQRGFIPDLPCATRSWLNCGLIQFFQFFLYWFNFFVKISTCSGCNSTIWWLATIPLLLWLPLPLLLPLPLPLPLQSQVCFCWTCDCRKSIKKPKAHTKKTVETGWEKENSEEYFLVMSTCGASRLKKSKFTFKQGQ